MCIVSLIPHSHFESKYNFYSHFVNRESYLSEVTQPVTWLVNFKLVSTSVLDFLTTMLYNFEDDFKI